MAESLRSDQTSDADDSNDAINIPSWKNSQDLDSAQKRYDIMQNITEERSLDQLKAIVDSGWDVNERIYDDEAGRYVHKPALHEATQKWWTEGVKLLLHAGAKTKTLDGLQNLLTLALKDCDCPIDLIKLLLEHGVDPNDHDDQGNNVPLLNAILNRNSITVIELLLQHGANPNVSHNRNDCDSPKWVIGHSALQLAAGEKWSELVKVLIAAGAKCNTHNGHNTLAMALCNRDCPPDLIKLLLEHGADPNDHDDEFINIPLLVAIGNLEQDNTIIVELLLEYGAKPEVIRKERKRQGPDGDEKWEQSTALHAAGRSGLTELVKIFIDADFVTPAILSETLVLALLSYDPPSDLIELLLKQGADLNYSGVGNWPLIHQLAELPWYGEGFLEQLQQLDLFFLHGGNINMEAGFHKTALEYAVQCDIMFYRGGEINSIRWLIRHGADISRITFSCFKGYFMPSPDHINSFFKIPLILLQAGMRISQGAQTELSNMDMAISAFLQEGTVEEQNDWRGSCCLPDDTGPEGIIIKTIKGVWDKIEQIEDEELRRVQYKPKKSIFPEYLPQQMVDLQQFSDESLHVYPDDIDPCPDWSGKEMYQNSLDLIHRVLDFLSRPQSLPWYCRRCVRENLVSLQPSVVKTLPVPSRLKRYILCHEI